MAIQSCVAFATLLAIDFQLHTKIRYLYSLIRPKRRDDYLRTNSTISSLVTTEHITTHGTSRTTEDNDVINENERIRTSSPAELMRTDVLVLNQVEKVFNGMFHAVDQISVGVRKKECFGLLGVNGA